LVIGLLIVSELYFTYACLEYVDHVKILKQVYECVGVTLFFLMWLGLPYVTIRVTPVVILALAGILLWAWRDRRRS
jgi:hypothetical protein